MDNVQYLDAPPDELLSPIIRLALQSYSNNNFRHANLPPGLQTCGVSATPASSRSTSSTDTSLKTGAPNKCARFYAIDFVGRLSGNIKRSGRARGSPR
jgi:hypothetical protein